MGMCLLICCGGRRAEGDRLIMLLITVVDVVNADAVVVGAVVC